MYWKLVMELKGITPATVMVILRKTVASIFTADVGGEGIFKEKGAGFSVMGKEV